ncbi:hypothetical protein OG453_06945 [Streptomyces sp. NBC_01381]|uniref:hypothetical protein n=1 Tax=Streptomyces sp. NBC_01381 TaxID=2903845 RepID=UPI00224D1044|nr:hypothetical protein [Streptomyces sp. NBC_01381]MCX4666404.1 hypothetical protein [Streptomyces sp. NBC_01381]
MITTKIPRTTATRPGLGDDWLAIWEVTFYEANPEGAGHQHNGRCWTTEVEAHPLTSNRTVGHQVWLYLNRERPDIPEVDLLSGHVRFVGYATGEPARDGKTPRAHGVRCIDCGSHQVAFTVRAWANCQACGKGQTQSEAMLCSDHCDGCREQSRANP